MPPKELRRISPALWELPSSFKYGMTVPARIYATEKLLAGMDDGVFSQVSNLASMPGTVNYAIAMPDAHWGYGSPVGGVAAFDAKEGIISPGMIGFDINCGMRLLSTNLSFSELKPKLRELVHELFKSVPSGVGAKGFLKPNRSQFEEVMTEGSNWCAENNYAWKEDLSATEDEGKISGANPEKVSKKAVDRGLNHLGTLGSGNHYLEIQIAESAGIFDSSLAKSFGISGESQVMVMFHCGSRGFGHQIATDYLERFIDAMPKHKIKVNGRELACAPIQSEEGSDYLGAMACAANMAFANRQIILHKVRECFSRVFGKSAEEMEMNQIYDVCHNIAKFEKYKVEGKTRALLVHRKGATRSLGKENELLSAKFQKTGQPVIIGGSMETGSYLLVGTKKAEEEAFGSSCHGSGRTMSRTKARHEVNGSELQRKMAERGILVESASLSGLAEEAGIAYKEISEVIESVEVAGLSKKVAALKPVGNVKG